MFFVHRSFPRQDRYKTVFIDKQIPPLYIHIDSTGTLNVDTRFVMPDLHDWIATRLMAMRTALYAVASDEERQMYGLTQLYEAHVTLQNQYSRSIIKLRFDENIEEYALNSPIDSTVLLDSSMVLDDFLDTALQSSSR
jgi:hypothetical protein